MKNYLQISLAGLALLTNPAFAVPEGWYAGLFGELSHTADIDFTLSPESFATINGWLAFLGFGPLTTPAGNIDYSIGGGGGGQIGYRYCGFRFEGELLYNYSPYDKITVGGLTLSETQNSSFAFPFSNLTIDGNTTLGAAFFNVFYDLYDDECDDVCWVPYVGLGIGYGYVSNDFELNFVTPGPTSGAVTTNLINLSENESTPVGQAIVGVSYFFNNNFSAGLDYRYVTTKEITHFDERLTLHTLNLSFNYWFNA